jgi:hypothetical protein
LQPATLSYGRNPHCISSSPPFNGPRICPAYPLTASRPHAELSQIHSHGGRGVLVELDCEFEHILRHFKAAHPSLQALAVTSHISLAALTNDLVLCHLRRHPMTLFPSYLFHLFPTPLLACIHLSSRSRGAGTWERKVSTCSKLALQDFEGNDPDWNHLPDGAECAAEADKKNRI